MILINSSPRNALGVFQPFLPISVPMGIGYIAASLGSRGIASAIVDEQVEGNVLDKIAQYVKRLEPPYIFGFSVLTATFQSAITLSARLKHSYRDSVVVFGGIHPTAMPEEVLSYDSVDIVFRGEVESVIGDLYYCIKNRKNIDNFDGISYKQNGVIFHNRSSDIVGDIDALPPFPYHMFDNNSMYDLGFVMSSRGCPYHCIFCSNRVATKTSYRFRSSESVMDDITLLHDKYGLRSITFFDDNFLVNRNRIFDLTSKIREHGFDRDTVFAFQARGDNANREILTELYRSGFRSVFFGVETASNRLLTLIRKGETVEEISSAVTLSKNIGFHVSAAFIFSLPTETHVDRMASLILSKQLRLDMVRYNNATPYPGTELYRIAVRENRLNVSGLYRNFVSVSTFVENPFNKIPFAYVPDGNTESEIRQDLLFSYFSFYFDWKKLKEALLRPDRGVKWFNARGRRMEVLAKKIPALILLGSVFLVKFSELFLRVLFKWGTSLKRSEFVSLLFRRG